VAAVRASGTFDWATLGYCGQMFEPYLAEMIGLDIVELLQANRAFDVNGCRPTTGNSHSHPSTSLIVTCNIMYSTLTTITVINATAIKNHVILLAHSIGSDSE
jgi:hypothetical protein